MCMCAYHCVGEADAGSSFIALSPYSLRQALSIKPRAHFFQKSPSQLALGLSLHPPEMVGWQPHPQGLHMGSGIQSLTRLLSCLDSKYLTTETSPQPQAIFWFGSIFSR